MKRYLVALISGALLGLAPLSVTAQAAPAAPEKQADEAWSVPAQRSARAINVPTKVVLGAVPKKALYKTAVRMDGQVLAQNPADGSWGYLTLGTVTLQRSWKGSKAWKTVSSRDLAAHPEGLFSFVPSAQRNAAYRISYSGSTSGEYTLTPSSATRSLGVARRFNESITKRTLIFRGRIVPSFARKAVVIERRTCATCKWKRYAKVRTDGRSRWSKKVAAPRSVGQRWYFRAVTPGSKQYIKSYSRTAETFRTR
ncbi:hypothetical protein [Nocardioides pacificus]